MSYFTCYHCGKVGHPVAECPLMTPASSFEEHRARIDGYVDSWVRGDITTDRKRKMISDENLLWHGQDVRRALVYP